MKFSCSDILVPGNTYTEKADNLKRWGFEGLTIYADYGEWDVEKEEEVFNLQRNTGIEVAEFVFVGEMYGHLMDEDEEKSQETLSMYCEAARIAGRIGAVTEFECDIRRKGALSFEYNDYPVLPEQQMKRLVTLYRKICDYQGAENTDILLEAVNRYEALYVNRQQDALDIIRHVDRKNTGLLCDLFHMSLDEENICGVLVACAPYIKHIHLGDSNRRLPGKGCICWEDIFRTLKTIGYDKYLSLECAVMGNPENELQAVSDFLHKSAC